MTTPMKMGRVVHPLPVCEGVEDGSVAGPDDAAGRPADTGAEAAAAEAPPEAEAEVLPADCSWRTTVQIMAMKSSRLMSRGGTAGG